MADDKNQTGTQDRARVALEQDYEVADFARKHGITAEEARRVIAENGPLRQDVEAAMDRRSSK